MPGLQTSLSRFLEFREDLANGRIPEKKQDSKYRKVVDELKARVPANYDLKLQPLFFNYIEAERIKAAVGQLCFDLLAEEGQDLYYSIGVKIFPMANSINSVRIVIM